MGNWDTEEESPEYKVKSRLVLEGSDKHEWGVVKDCKGCVNYIPDDAEVVGTWSKYGEGVFWVSLQTSLQALSDRATQLFVELAKRRAEEPLEVRPSRKREPAQPAPPAPKFSGLRAKLAAAKNLPEE